MVLFMYNQKGTPYCKRQLGSANGVNILGDGMYRASNARKNPILPVVSLWLIQQIYKASKSADIAILRRVQP